MKKYRFWKDLAWISVLLIAVITMGVYAKHNQVVVNAATLIYITPTPVQYVQPELAGLEDQVRARAIIKKIWRKDWKTGLAIAICESGLREKIVGKATRDVGYFQVNPVHGFIEEDMQNGVANASYAYTLYKEQGLTPWNSSRSCWGDKI